MSTDTPVLHRRCPLNKSDVSSFDFAINQFLMELFKTKNIRSLKNVAFFFRLTFLARKFHVKLID